MVVKISKKERFLKLSKKDKKIKTDESLGDIIELFQKRKDLLDSEITKMT